MRRKDRSELTGGVFALLAYVSAVTAVLTPIIGDMLRGGDWLPAVAILLGVTAAPRLVVLLVRHYRRRPGDDVSAEHVPE